MNIRRLISVLLLAPLLFSSSFVYANNPSLVLAATNWEPIMGEEMKNGGYLTEVISTALKRAGYSVEIRWVPWKRAIEMSKQGIYDGVIAASYTKERHQHFNCTLPIVTDDFAYFGLAHQPLNHTPFFHCNPVTIGILRGSAIIQTLQKNKNIIISQANNHNQNIKKLLAGRIHFIIGSKISIQHMLARQFPDQQKNIAAIEPIYRKNQYHILFSRQCPEHANIVGSFNQAFKQMRKEGIIDKILHEHNLDQAVLPLDRSERTQL